MCPAAAAPQQAALFTSSLRILMIFRVEAGAASDFALMVSSMSWHPLESLFFTLLS
jgi:hypothetical protein